MLNKNNSPPFQCNPTKPIEECKTCRKSDEFQSYKNIRKEDTSRELKRESGFDHLVYGRIEQLFVQSDLPLYQSRRILIVAVGSDEIRLITPYSIS